MGHIIITGSASGVWITTEGGEENDGEERGGEENGRAERRIFFLHVYSVVDVFCSPTQAPGWEDRLDKECPSVV